MAEQTPNLGLTKPARSELYDVAVTNANMDKIDAELGEVTAKTVGEYNITEFVGSDGVVTSEVVQTALDAIPEGSKLKFPSGEYSFDSININKRIEVDLQNSVVTSASTNATVFAIEGSLDSTSYLLTNPLKRRDRVLMLTESPSDISAGDLILLKDDAVRATDGNGDMNVEVHEVESVDINAKTITLKDFVRHKKAVSSTANVHKIKPVENVTIRNAKIKQAEGSTSGNGILAKFTRGVRVYNVTGERIAGTPFFASRSYDFMVSGFRMAYPQQTGSGKGYGVQMFGVNNFTIENGIGIEMRHVFDAHSSFDGLVDNVVSLSAVSAQFVLSHNGWGGDITLRKCRSYGGKTYGISLSSQGLANPLENPLYGITIEDCDIQLIANSNVFQHGFISQVPLKESKIDGLKVMYGDGTVRSPGDNYGVYLQNVDTDISVSNVEVSGFNESINLFSSTTASTTDEAAIIKLRNIRCNNANVAIRNRYGTRRKMIVENVSVSPDVTFVYSLGYGDWSLLKIDGVSAQSPTVVMASPFPIANSNGLRGGITNIIDNAITTPIKTVTNSTSFDRVDMYQLAQNGVLQVSSASDVSLVYPFLDGIYEGQKFSVMNVGGFSISISNTSKLATKTGETRVIPPNDTLHLVWLNGKWREI